jgi:hypothetical protein
MIRIVFSSMLIVFVFAVFTMGTLAQDKDFKYVGAKNCKMCHSSKKSGEAFKIWEASAHAKAYLTLASEESKAIGKKMGIEDPQKSDKCLSCHITGHGQPASKFEKTYLMEEGVSCEACHGAGSAYNPMKIMKQIKAGEVKAADYGLLVPNEASCKTCHNEKSPTFKGFDFKKYTAQIAHPTPKE